VRSVAGILEGPFAIRGGGRDGGNLRTSEDGEGCLRASRRAETDKSGGVVEVEDRGTGREEILTCLLVGQWGLFEEAAMLGKEV